MDDSIFSTPPTHARPASAMRRNHSTTQHFEHTANGLVDNRYTPPVSSSASVASSSQHSVHVAGTPKQGSLLQERLRERKVESARAAGMSAGDMGARDRDGVKSSPIKGSTREERRPSSGGVGQSGKGMGVKQIEDQVSTLHKQNFDLKLELYHRRQRQESLEAQLEEKTRQLEEYDETRELNDQLLAELERRDQALDEAVGVIVNLEEKVERLMKEREMVKAVDDNPYNPPSEFSSSPPRFDEDTPRKKVIRMPSFLSEQSENTEALRSLYLPHHRSFSETSLPKLDEEDSYDVMNSPRLSVLSESSFLSVYGEKLDLNVSAEQEPQREQTEAAVDKWVAERPSEAVAPPRQSTDLLRTKQFISINDVLESPLQRLEKLKQTLERAALPVPERFSSAAPRNKRRGANVKDVFVGKKSFERQHSLPPTPDTFSTNTLRHYKGSDDTLAQRGSTYLSTTSSFTPDLTQNTFHSAHPPRPRSACETITSRREGHGWDTETQGDATESGSVTSEASTYAPAVAFQPLAPRIRRVRTPDLFNFSTSEISNGTWARDVMFSHGSVHEELDHPPLNNKRIDRARRSSMIEAQHAKSDDAAVQSNGKYGNGPTNAINENSPRPELPDRRSSLIAMTKIRRGSSSAQSPATKEGTQQQQLPAPAPVSRTTRIASKLFGRHQSSPSTATSEMTTSQPQPTSNITSSNHVPNSLPLLRQRPLLHSSNSSYTRAPTTAHYPSVQDSLHSIPLHALDLHGESATPPPIRRSKTYAPTNMSSRKGVRPASAGTGAVGGSAGGLGSGVKVKRLSGFHPNVNDDTTSGAGSGAFNNDEDYFLDGIRVGDGSGGHSQDSDTKSGRDQQHHLRRESVNVDVGVARGLGALLGTNSGSSAEETATEKVDGGAAGEGKRKWLGLRRH